VRRGFGRVIDADFRTETFRKGVDFAARLGEPVRAVASGQVRFAGWFRGYGKMVILDHGDQYFTVSGHLDEIRVSVGDAVEAGQVVGTAGDTGSLAGALLYFELRRGGEALDPAEWLEGTRRVAPAPPGG
jgi:septal ring factor EnvC (AmiA/AmiB activator)